MSQDISEAIRSAIAVIDENTAASRSSNVVVVLIVTTILWFSVLAATWMWFKNIDERLTVQHPEVITDVMWYRDPIIRIEARQEAIEVKLDKLLQAMEQ